MKIIEVNFIFGFIIIFALWLFVLFMLLYFIAMLCRELAFWHETDKIKDYVTVSPRLAALLIPKYIYIRCVSVSRSGYYVNIYPNRLPMPALVDYCGAAILFILSALSCTFYFLTFSVTSLLPVSAMLLMAYLIIFFFVLRWDHSRCLNEAALITRAEMKRLKRESRQLHRD